MILIRSLLFQLVLALSTLVFATAVLIVGWGFPDRLASRVASTWGRFNLAALGLICGLRYRVRGLEHLPAENAVVLCKHQSAWETIALRGLLPPDQTWVLKRELMRIPFFGWAMGRLQPIAIDRAAGRRAVIQLIRDGLERLERGRWVIVFPEGTRVPPGERHPYAPGGAALAERSGRPVIPVAHNAGYFWGRRSLRKRPGTIELVIGPPIDSRGRSVAELNAAVEDWIEGTLAGLPAGPAAG